MSASGKVETGFPIRSTNKKVLPEKWNSDEKHCLQEVEALCIDEEECR